VREYARLQHISPPTASKVLSSLAREGALKKEEDKRHILYYANGGSALFVDLSRIYWRQVLEASGLINALERELLRPVVILFGSLSKAEAKEDSDIDLAVFTASKKEIAVHLPEKYLKRKAHILIFQKMDDAPKELLHNILNGHIVHGAW